MGIIRFFVCLFLLLLGSASLASDTDNDGLPDAWEESNGLNKYNYTDAASDADNDGLTALEEFNLGTSPISDDTDRDFLLDGWEVENEKNPLFSNYQVSSGDFSSCLLDDLGVRCWYVYDYSAQEVPVLNNPIQIATGANHSCAIDDSGVICWGGYNESGEITVPDLNNPSQISLGGQHSCVIDGTEVVCWGDNTYGQVQVPELSNPFQISLGADHSCALDETGVVCWGRNNFNQTTVPTLNNPKEISTGYETGCAIDDSGVICWGKYPVLDVPELINPSQISLWHDQACANTDLGVVCWDYDGQKNVPELSNPIQIATGAYFTCAIDDSGLVCWGDNENYAFYETLLVDPDEDGYSNLNGEDAFPYDSNEWIDSDIDGIGNNADIDDDNDGVNDLEDALPFDSNETTDTDADGIGDNADAFPNNPNETVDTDEDGVGDNADNCPKLNNSSQLDTDGDELGNACDEDDDNDGFTDINDDLPLDATEQLDFDGDGIGNNADTDDDGDGIEDSNDAFSLNSLYSADSDNDGMADAWELLYGLNPNDPSDTASDQDDDGAVALQEFIEGTLPVADADNDGLSDNYEASIGTNPNNSDSDDDGVNDKDDALPLNSAETTDTDQDGVGDNSDNCPDIDNPDQLDTDGDAIGDACDTDADNDGIPNDYETAYGLNPADASDAQSDSDMDGLTALEEFTAGTNPNAKPLDQLLVGTWTFVQEANSVAAGVFLGDSSVWANSESDLPNMDCMFDDRLIFKEDGTHQFLINGLTWGPWFQLGYQSISDVISISCDNEKAHILDLVDRNGTWAVGDMIGGLEELTTLSFIGESYFLVSIDNTRASFYVFNGEIYWRVYLDKLQDQDFDGVEDNIDNCPETHNIDQKNDDNDPQGNACDLDDDNDGFEDNIEIQNGFDPLVANLDIDNDGITNELDTDNDNDGTEDTFDSFPFNALEQLDHDNDGVGNNADTDDDGDGVNDALDLFPLDAFESADSDGDGVGDNADFFPNSAEYSLDSDLDQMPDAWERKYGLNPTDASDALLDQDNDGLTALEEYEAGTVPLKILDIDANGSFDALTDGLIILRYAFGLRGQSLINGVISEDAMRNNASDIEAYIDSLVPGL